MTAEPSATASAASTGAQVEPDPLEQAARARVGRAIRRAHHALVGRQIDPSSLNGFAELLESWTSTVANGAPRARPASSFLYEELPPIADGEVLHEGYGDRPFSGVNSPWGLELEVRRNNNVAECTLSLGAAHEGAPGRSHGGVVAALFDDVTGFVLQLVPATAFTGELSVRYLAGVPIGVPLVCRCWLASREGRKLFMEGELCHGDVRVATCRATYITVNRYD